MLVQTNASLSEILKNLSVFIQSSSLNDRKIIFNNLVKLIDDKDIEETTIRGLFKVLLLTFFRYNDTKSISLVKRFVEHLIRKYPSIGSKHLTLCLYNYSQLFKQHLNSSKSVARISLTPLKLSLCVQWNQLTDNDLKAKLIESQAIISTVITVSDSQKIIDNAYKKLKIFWKSIPIEEYLETLAKLSTNCSSSDASIALHLAIVWDFVIKYLSELKSFDSIAKYKPVFKELFLKHIIGCKTKLSNDLIRVGFKYQLKQITHEDFTQSFLPSIQRAVLRNPEVVLNLIAIVLKGLSLDLSPYALDIGKLLASQLHSKEETLRLEAICGTKNLAKQCSNSVAIESLLKHYFAVLNGSEGKLTITAQRLGVVSGIGALSCHSVSGEAQHLSEMALESFVTLLKTEVHEPTIIHMTSQMQKWCYRLVNEIPKVLIDWFKALQTAKTSTAYVKSSYICCLNASFKQNMSEQANDILSILTNSAQKSFTSTVSQMPVLTEGLYAINLILKLLTFDRQYETKIKSLFNQMFDTEKMAFLSDKFIVSTSEETLQIITTFIDTLVFNYETKLESKMKPLNKALLLLMTHPMSYSVRKQALISGKKLAKNSINAKFAIDLLKEFYVLFKDSIINQDITSISGDENQQNSDMAKQPSISALIECHNSLVSFSSDPQIKKDLLLVALHTSHINILFSSNPYLWLNLLRKTIEQKMFDKYIDENKEILIKTVLREIDDNSVKTNAIKALVCLAPHDFIPILLSKAVNTLSKPDFKIITQMDYEIYLTPEGQLYDSSALESLKNDNQSNKNIKRESKLYSYKDQMEEIELRKELEAKRKAQGDTKEPQLSKKQLEVKQQQLEKESQIRSKLKTNYEEFRTAIDLIEAIAVSSTAISTYINDVLFSLINLFSSPLCAVRATHLFTDLRKSLFNQKDSELKRFGDSLAFITLRRLKPFCPIDQNWMSGSLNDRIDSLISSLYKRTCRPTGRDYDEKTAQLAIKSRLTAPAFAYCFPLIQSLLLSSDTKEEQILQCLSIISEHTQMRTTYTVDDDEDETIALKDPQYLPLKYMFDTMIKVIAKSPVHIEQTASKVLLDISLCANGSKGCAKASFDEINILLEALKSDVNEVRISTLSALSVLANNVLVNIKDQNSKFVVTHRVFVSQFDPLDQCSANGQRLFGECLLRTSVALCDALIEDILLGNSVIRHSVAGAMEALLSEYPEQTSKVILKLMDIYREKAKVLPPTIDSFGRQIANSAVDPFEPRLGVALILTQIAELVPKEIVEEMAKFYVPEALGDRNEKVQSQMLEGGCALVNLHGKDNINLLLNVFEKFLDEAPDTSDNDAVRRSVVVLMGTLARHIDKDNPKVKPIVAKLIEALSTPSQMVQEAVANCLPYLIPAFKEEAPSLLQKLIQLLLESDSYGERKGAAYGIAGIIKGLGILSLKQLGIMDALTEAIQDKKNPNHREGALFAFEMLCSMLGRLFEPYIVHILPHLLLCFGDSSNRVRQATDDTAKQVMSKLSAHGVKLVLPSLLNALEEDSWRTKAGSIELLGAMAFCAPKQLSSCLPSIVPKLMTVMSDSHPRVQNTAAQALKQIGSVIRNPEIQAIVPVLLEALQDPANKTSKCLNTMLNTKFVHFIDAPSLALIMPVVERAFQGRSTETRKMAAQIIGNMYALTDQKDLSPYLPSIIPGLKQSLLDPVPEVRGVTARALGAMVKGMGEDIFEDLMPWLMSTLTSETSSVDRSGAAQGLSEVMGGLGLERLEKFIPEIIETTERTDIAPHVKDGYIMLFIYLPMVFTQDFTKYIGRIINPVLKALADENEFVRETALRAGQRIVNMYAETAIQLLLPELERGLFDENWRIRYSSVQLLGDLLFKISGVTGKMTTETADEDDNFGTEQSHRAIMSALGGDRRNRVLSGLYMGRSDVSLQVRQAALHVWKVVVTNTPRTLKEILPTLFSLLLGCLASNSSDKQQVAARTLGDLVRKLGERILPEIIPILEQGLESERSDQRQGVCIGLSEIMASTSREMVQAFVESLVPTVKKALFDPLPEVRQAAAKTFDSLHAAVGVRALDDILPALLNQLGDPVKGERTLDGLRQVMAIKSRVVLPYLVPQLTVPPVNTRALSFLSTVAGESLSRHLPKILPALLLALSEAIDTPNEKQELEYCQSVILSVSDEMGARTIVDHLLESARNESSRIRHSSVLLLYAYCSQSKANISSNISQLIRGLILLFTDSNEQVLSQSWEALNAITKSMESKEQMEYVSEVRNAVRYAVSDLKSSAHNGTTHLLLPGFCLSKGITPILPIFREAILNGNPEQKEQAAHGLSEVIELTSAEALKPSVVNIAGPLIRILGDRFTWNVKVAVLDTLSLLLSKVGALLRPFIPQLQQTFLKALNDGHRSVRLRAANALSQLIGVHNRCDPVFTELHNAIKSTANSDDSSLRETMLHALRLAIAPAGDKMSDSVRRQLTATIISLLGSPEDSCRSTAAACLGVLCAWLPNDELNTIAKDHLLDDDMTVDWTLRHGRSVALRISLKEASNRLIKQEWIERICKTLIAFISSDRVPIVMNGIKGSSYLIKDYLNKSEVPPQTVLTAFARGMNHSSNEVKQTVAISTTYIAKWMSTSVPPVLFKTLVPLVVNGTKEKNTMVRANSEHALVAFLKLKSGDDVLQSCLSALDSGAAESLQDCINKTLKKVAQQPLHELSEEEFDDTLLT